MPTTLSPEAKKLIDRPNFAHLATLMPDGSPQSVGGFDEIGLGCFLELSGFSAGSFRHQSSRYRAILSGFGAGNLLTHFRGPQSGGCLQADRV